MLTHTLKKTKSFYVLTLSLIFWLVVALFAINFWEFNEPRSFIMLLHLLISCAVFIVMGYREIQQKKKRNYDHHLLSSPTTEETTQLLFISSKKFLKLSIVAFYILLTLLSASVALIFYDFIKGSVEYSAFAAIYLELFFISYIVKETKALENWSKAWSD